MVSDTRSLPTQASLICVSDFKRVLPAIVSQVDQGPDLPRLEK